MTQSRPRVLVIGAGFAGFHALRRLERRLPAEAAELVLVNPTDYLLYTPLVPEVATGALQPRDAAVPLRQALPRTRRVLGQVTAVDLSERTVTVELLDTGGQVSGTRTESWDRLVLTPGSVTRQFDIPGLAEHALGVKTLTEALYLRDHLLTQLDRADTTPATEDGERERRERLTVVAVGAGYTGVEVVAQLRRWTHTVADRWSRIKPTDVRWLLIDIADTVLPELGAELGDVARDVLRDRGIEIRLGVSLESAGERSVTLTDGTVVPTRTVIWGAGVSANPLVAGLGRPLEKGRLVVDAQLRVPGVEHVWAAGDAAAVPDLTKQPTSTDTGGDDGDGGVAYRWPPTPTTAQHAQRQGVALARNVAASLGVGRARPYRHHNLGLVADLGGWDAVAQVLGVSLAGPAAKTVTRAYHLLALPMTPNRVRVAADWLLAAALPSQVVQLSEVQPGEAVMARAQRTDIYPRDR
ncbi:NAD(P)/FAD-dependent oxidoreductase [Geodermatophilus sp. TF02-6]|uniref:NAD(P)/FAD-dependent oxidoreductase n=1 Tax=Geodermatophilus sp. TF02-6 TaxID=2250575 RepID=UPI000DE947E2|nr:NAD(P)/FAD-dependent oxidoreductase [Geodermatophilus sp. TF02-6]RBY83832.1 NAD(P)/FAD-dependent oxidoreductase [Geodermatophilus sp. TF02-6]